MARIARRHSVRARRGASVREVDASLQRAADEVLLRSGLPQGRASALLPRLMHLASRLMPELSPAQAADVVVDTMLCGLGASGRTPR